MNFECISWKLKKIILRLVQTYIRTYVQLGKKELFCFFAKAWFTSSEDIWVRWSANSLPFGYSLLVNCKYYINFVACFSRENLPWDNPIKRQYRRITFLCNFNVESLWSKNKTSFRETRFDFLFFGLVIIVVLLDNSNE